MRFDHVIIRLSAVLGAEWLQAYALVNLKPSVDVDKFRFRVPKYLTYHHENEKYLGGVPGDLFIGFFAKGQAQLFDEMSKIKALKEVQEVSKWAIGNFPINKLDMTKLDWQIVKRLRRDAEKTPNTIAKELNEDPGTIKERLDFIKTAPFAFSIERPNKKAWTFGEIHVNFQGTTFKKRLKELSKIGKPFGAISTENMGAIMIKPDTLDDFLNAVRRVQKISGVNISQYAFCEDMIWSQPWLDDFIDEQINGFE